MVTAKDFGFPKNELLSLFAHSYPKIPNIAKNMFICLFLNMFCINLCVLNVSDSLPWNHEAVQKRRKMLAFDGREAV